MTAVREMVLHQLVARLVESQGSSWSEVLFDPTTQLKKGLLFGKLMASLPCISRNPAWKRNFADNVCS